MAICHLFALMCIIGMAYTEEPKGVFLKVGDGVCSNKDGLQLTSAFISYDTTLLSECQNLCDLTVYCSYFAFVTGSSSSGASNLTAGPTVPIASGTSAGLSTTGPSTSSAAGSTSSTTAGAKRRRRNVGTGSPVSVSISTGSTASTSGGSTASTATGPTASTASDESDRVCYGYNTMSDQEIVVLTPGPITSTSTGPTSSTGSCWKKQAERSWYDCDSRGNKRCRDDAPCKRNSCLPNEEVCKTCGEDQHECTPVELKKIYCDATETPPTVGPTTSGSEDVTMSTEPELGNSEIKTSPPPSSTAVASQSSIFLLTFALLVVTKLLCF